jgi:toxin-antitoxin system PIN domain toxin
VDSNILVYCHREDTLWSDRAQECVRTLAEGSDPWSVPWPCLYEFVAVVTHPDIFTTPTPMANALDQVAAWLESPSLVLLSEGRGRGESGSFWDRLAAQLLESRSVGPLVHDARVAALCLANKVTELWTADRDFGRFPTLRVRNPLVGGTAGLRW